MNQKEAVFQVVSSIKSIEGKTTLTSTEKEDVYTALQVMFMSGEAEYKGARTEDAIAKYIPGLVNNWLRKDTRLNGGDKYVTKNPGSRSGSGDASLRAMKALLVAQPENKAVIQAAIDQRKSELKPKVEVNVALLPEALRHLVA